MHDVLSIMKKDVVRSAEWGAMIGVLAAALTLAIAYVSGLTRSVGWLPFVFLAVVLLGILHVGRRPLRHSDPERPVPALRRSAC